MSAPHESGVDSNTYAVDADLPSPDDLTRFQLDILTVLAEQPLYGLAIKDELEDYYGEDVFHGRLYPNLDQLATLGLVEKSELDKRTNEYAATDQGTRAVERRYGFTAGRLGRDGEVVS